MSTGKNNEVSKDYGYQPRRSINEGYQPSEERGYQPTSSGNTSSQTDNPPSGGSSVQSTESKK